MAAMFSGGLYPEGAPHMSFIIEGLDFYATDAYSSATDSFLFQHFLLLFQKKDALD